MKKAIVVTYLVVLNSIVSALPAQDTPLLSPEQMREDIEYYFSTVLNHNYAILYYGRQHIIDSIQHELLTACNEPLTVKEFNYRLARTNKYMDGHTHISFLKSTREAFPYVKFSSGGLMMKDIRILAIEGIEATQVMDDVDRMTTWEYNEKGRERFMNLRLNRLLEEYYNLTPPYRCRIYDTGSGEEKDSLIHTIPTAEFWKYFQPVYNDKYHAPALNYAVYPEDSIAVLYYNSSVNIQKKEEEQYEKFLYDFFTILDNQHIRYLFIDVSQNGGGSDHTHEYIYKYLKSEPYIRKAVLYSTPYMAFNYYEQQMDLLMQDPQFKGKSKGEVLEIIKEHEDWRFMQQFLEERKFSVENEIKANPDGFAGKVFVIMGFHTYSAGYDFCEEIKRRKIGILTGEELMQRTPYAGEARSGILPHSNITFYYASKFFTLEPVLTNEQSFLQPDIPYNMEKPLELEDFKTIIKLAEEKKEIR